MKGLAIVTRPLRRWPGPMRVTGLWVLGGLVLGAGCTSDSKSGAATADDTSSDASSDDADDAPNDTAEDDPAADDHTDASVANDTADDAQNDDVADDSADAATDDTGDDTNDNDGPDAGVVEASIELNSWIQSGERLKARVAVADGEVIGRLGWYDSQLEIDCAPLTAGDGEPRCLPQRYTNLYCADPLCEQPVLVVEDCDPPAGDLLFVTFRPVRRVSSIGSGDHGHRLHALPRPRLSRARYRNLSRRSARFPFTLRIRHA